MNYYFTFGPSHYNNEGQAMRAYWVRVVAEDYSQARDMFINGFMSVYMPRKDAFAFQREERHFVKKFFPGGEFAVLGEYTRKEFI